MHLSLIIFMVRFSFCKIICIFLHKCKQNWTNGLNVSIKDFRNECFWYISQFNALVKYRSETFILFWIWCSKITEKFAPFFCCNISLSSSLLFSNKIKTKRKYFRCTSHNTMIIYLCQGSECLLICLGIRKKSYNA